MVLHIGIDTSFYLKYSCMISGFNSTIIERHKKMREILESHGHSGPMHWKTIRAPIRKKAATEMYNLMNKKGVNIYIYKHKRPAHIRAEDFYCKYIPHKMANDINRTMFGKQLIVKIEIDDDFNISTLPLGSKLFAKKFLEYLIFKLTNSYCPIFPRRNKFRADIKQLGGAITELSSTVIVGLPKPLSIEISDVFLGFSVYDKTKWLRKRHLKGVWLKDISNYKI